MYVPKYVSMLVCMYICVHLYSLYVCQSLSVLSLPPSMGSKGVAHRDNALCLGRHGRK